MSLLSHMSKGEMPAWVITRLKNSRCNKCHEFFKDNDYVLNKANTRKKRTRTKYGNWYHRECYQDGKGRPIHELPNM